MSKRAEPSLPGYISDKILSKYPGNEWWYFICFCNFNKRYRKRLLPFWNGLYILWMKVLMEKVCQFSYNKQNEVFLYIHKYSKVVFRQKNNKGVSTATEKS